MSKDRPKLRRFKFTKMHALGNDFVLLDLISQPGPEPAFYSPQALSQLGDRRLGVGFDQLLTLEPPTSVEADLSSRIYNSDGSPASMCLNGARCLAELARRRALVGKETVASTGLRLSFSGGLLVCRYLGPAHEHSWETLLPKESFPSSVQPFDLPALDTQATLTGDSWLVNVGNEHLGLVLHPEEDLARLDLEGLYAEISGKTGQDFNLSVYQPQRPGLVHLRIRERGAGETMACGSAALAGGLVAFAQSWHEEHSGDKRVVMRSPGGSLEVRDALDADRACLRLRGGTSWVFDGYLRAGVTQGV